MAKARKTAREKLEARQQAEVVDDRRGRGKMLIPRPLDVDALVRRVPPGKLVTVDQIRERLAGDHNADLTCPLCTGIFLRLSAEAAEEDRARGEEEISPYWRVLKTGGGLNDRLPGGVEAQAVRLAEEGHSIEPGKGKKAPRLRGFERCLHAL